MRARDLGVRVDNPTPAGEHRLLKTRSSERLVASDTLLILIGPDTKASRDDSAALGRLREERPTVLSRVGLDLDVRKADTDDQLVDWVEAANCAALIINVGGCRKPLDIDDLLSSPQTPVIEVRTDNPFRHDDTPEPLRRTEGPIGMVYGLGVQGYLMAINAAASRIAKSAS